MHFDRIECPQCLTTDLHVDIEWVPSQIVGTCQWCGHRTYVPIGDNAGDSSMVKGNGAYIVVTARNVHFGVLEEPWCEMYESYFRDVFKSEDIIYGRVTRWVEAENDAVVVHEIGDKTKLETIYPDLAETPV